MKRYFYIVWRTATSDLLMADVFDMTPAEWIIGNGSKLSKLDTFIIINQFEITAEQYTALESFQ